MTLMWILTLIVPTDLIDQCAPSVRNRLLPNLPRARAHLSRVRRLPARPFIDRARGAKEQKAACQAAFLMKEARS